jgi:hypothetical protein
LLCPTPAARVFGDDYVGGSAQLHRRVSERDNRALITSPRCPPLCRCGSRSGTWPNGPGGLASRSPLMRWGSQCAAPSASIGLVAAPRSTATAEVRQRCDTQQVNLMARLLLVIKVKIKDRHDEVHKPPDQAEPGKIRARSRCCRAGHEAGSAEARTHGAWPASRPSVVIRASRVVINPASTTGERASSP